MPRNLSHNSLKPRRADNSSIDSFWTISEHKVWKLSSLIFKPNTDDKFWLNTTLKKKTTHQFHLNVQNKIQQYIKYNILWPSEVHSSQEYKDSLILCALLIFLFHHVNRSEEEKNNVNSKNSMKERDVKLMNRNK